MAYLPFWFSAAGLGSIPQFLCYSVFTCKFNKGWSDHLTLLGVPFELNLALSRGGLFPFSQLGIALS